MTGVGESMRVTRCLPSSLLSVMIREPLLPSSIASARYLPPLGEKAAALGDEPNDEGVPELGYSTRPPGTSGAWLLPPSGVDVGFADGVEGAPATVGDGDAVADCGNRPTVLNNEPYGA